MSYLTAWGLPESHKKRPKKSKFDQRVGMAFHTVKIVRLFTLKKTSNQKKSGGKKGYNLAKYVIT